MTPPVPTRGLVREGLALFALLGLFAVTPPPAAAQTYTVTGRTDYATGAGLEWVAIWDLNNDGHKDLVTANYFSNSISVLLNNGAGGFLPRTDYAVGAGPFTVVVTDLNNDIQADLLVANFAAGTISVLLGNGTGAFGTRTDFPSGASTAVAATGDFNRDGNMDVVTANLADDNVAVFLGNGAGGFAPRTLYTTDTSPNWVAVGDFNQDNRLDLVTVNYNANSISVFLGNGNGTFAPRVDSPVGANPLTLTLADLNGDGLLDITSANYTANTISIRLGQGDGTFAPKIDHPTPAGPVTVTAGDLNVDGRIDLAVCNDGANSVSVFLGDGAGGVAPRTDHAVGSMPFAVAIGDVTGDGEPDLVSANFQSNDVSVLSGDVPGGFRIGSQVAALTGVDQSGSLRTLSSYLGKWVLLDMTAWWCPPCNFVSREAQQVYDTWIANPSIQFEYLTVLVDGPTPWVPATQYEAATWGYRYRISRPILHGAGSLWPMSRSFMEALGTNAYPTLVIIDPAGTIRTLEAGAYDGQTLVNRIAALAGVAAPALAPLPPPLPPPPPPPSVPGPPPALFLAMQSATIEVSYGNSTWSGPLNLISDPNQQQSHLEIAAGTTGVPGIPGVAWIGVNSIVDPTNATESVSIYVGTLDEQQQIERAEPWHVRLTNIVWPDGYPRAISQYNSPVVGAWYWDPQSATSPFFQTPISVLPATAGHDLDFNSFALGNVPNLPATTNAFATYGVILQHVGPVPVEPTSGPTQLALTAPYPNPATTQATLHWTMPREGFAALDVFDVSGRRVRSLHVGPAGIGQHASRWDLRDAGGARVPPGIFFVRFGTGGETRSTRLVVLD